MIDIHSHLIFDVDDGASSIDESVCMLLRASQAGVQAIIATPHFDGEIYDSGKISENYNQLLGRADDLDIALKKGLEVYISPLLPDLIDQRRSELTLNGSNFMLLEFPSNAVPEYSFETIYKLQLEGICPIIAHPEGTGSSGIHPGSLRPLQVSAA